MAAKHLVFTFTAYVPALSADTNLRAHQQAERHCPGAVIDDVEVTEWRADTHRGDKVLRWAADVRVEARLP